MTILKLPFTDHSWFSKYMEWSQWIPDSLFSIESIEFSKEFHIPEGCLQVTHDIYLYAKEFSLFVVDFTVSFCAKWSEVARSCLTLCDPIDCSLPGPSICGIFQARVLTGLSFPSPGDLPNPGIEHRSPTLYTDALPSEPPGKSIFCAKNSYIEKISLWEMVSLSNLPKYYPYIPDGRRRERKRLWLYKYKHFFTTS